MERKKGERFTICAMVFTVSILGQAVLFGQEKKPENSAAKPVPKDKKRHEGFVELAKKGGIDVLFLGDSITDGWRAPPGQEAWKKHFEPLHAANFGIGGDRTQHVLWRIENGELEGIHPKLAVLMIGTNNLGANKDEQIAEGITAIVHEIHKRQPETKVLLLGIFPRSQKASDPFRARIKDINKVIAKLDDGGKTVRYLDIGDKFVDKNGDLPKEIMPDYLHLSKAGYKIWADAIQPTVDEMLKN
jgi:lysophospholipase L1-like esterase